MDVGCIIPTVDRLELLNRAIRSAMAQEHPFSEILVVNDGPSTIELDALPQDKRIRIVKTLTYTGLPAARAFGLRELSPNIKAVCYLDDDDELLPNHVSSLLPSILSGHDFAFSKALFKYANGTETEDPEPNNRGPKRYYDPNALLEQNIAPVSSFIHSVHACRQIGGWDQTLIRMEDWDFWARMFIRFGPPVFVNKVTNVIYKGTAGNLTDSSQYSYSMACSWRDIVSDRIKFLAAEKRGKLTEGDLKKFHIPRVGVIMPVYNAERFLRKAVDSIFSQTYQDFELIAINDGSTDQSVKILESYLPKIRIFHMPQNSGVTKALNHALLMSRSELIARMDADDISMPERLAKQVEYLDHNKEIMVLGTYFNSVNEDFSALIWDNKDIPIEPDKVKETLLKHCCIGHPTVMMRRRIIEIMGGYNEQEEYRAVEDYELWLRISRRFKIANLPETLLYYREYDNQISKRFSDIQKTNTDKLRKQYES